MIQGFYSAASALKYRQYGLSVVADNIANLNTDTFKKSTAVFQEAIHSAYVKEYPNYGPVTYGIGSGAYTDTIVKDMSQGGLVQTYRELDLALEEDGFFALEDGSGNISYTRGGSFIYDLTQNQKFIVDGAGNYLLDRNMNRVAVPAGTELLHINETGRVLADGGVVANLALFAFENPGGLEKQGRGTYTPTDNSGEPVVANTVVKQGFLEKSNVNLISEMAELIENQRLFQINSRVIAAIDEVESMANKLRR